MGTYEPQTVDQLATVVTDIAHALAADGQALSPSRKQALAIRVLELYENGITDPEQLRLNVMADALWASSHPNSVPQEKSPANGRADGTAMI